jgi:hypothetical protein
VSARSRKRRIARRRSWRALLEIVRHTGKLYVAPDVWAAVQRNASSKVAQIIGHGLAMGARIEIVVNERLARGTIAGIAPPTSSLERPYEPMPVPAVPAGPRFRWDWSPWL